MRLPVPDNEFSEHCTGDMPDADRYLGFIPFASDSDAHTKADFCTQRRIRETWNFIDFGNVWGRDVLDIGGRNCVGVALEELASWDFHNTLACDFNYSIKAPLAKYDTILCLEVFEHVLNLLSFTESLRDTLKVGGVLYLSTPVHHPLGFIFNESAHVAEYRVSVVRKILEYRGLTVERVHTFKSIPFWQGLRAGGGVLRTIPRVYFQETMLIKARKR